MDLNTWHELSNKHKSNLNLNVYKENFTCNLSFVMDVNPIHIHKADFTLIHQVDFTFNKQPSNGCKANLIYSFK